MDVEAHDYHLEVESIRTISCTDIHAACLERLKLLGKSWFRPDTMADIFVFRASSLPFLHCPA